MSSWHWESHAAQHNLHRSNVSGNTLDLQGVDVEEVTCLAPKRLANHSAYPMASPKKRPWHQKCPCAQNAWALYYNTKWVKLIYSIYYNIEFGQVLMSFWAWQNQMFHLSFVSFIMGIPCTFPFLADFDFLCSNPMQEFLSVGIWPCIFPHHKEGITPCLGKGGTEWLRDKSWEWCLGGRWRRRFTLPDSIYPYMQTCAICCTCTWMAYRIYI